MPEIDSLVWVLATKIDPLVGGLSLAATKLRKFSALVKTGPIAGLAALGVVMTAVAVKATRMSASLDLALREVATLLPETVEQLDHMREAIIALSTRVPETPELLTAGLYQAVSAGFRDTADALKVTEAASKAAVAGLTNTETAMKAVISVMNAYRLSAGDAEHVSDVLFKTVERGVVRFKELADNIGTLSTSSALAGVSIQETMAGLATITKFGINAEEATVALNRFFLNLANQTRAQEKAAEALGIEFTITALKDKGFLVFMQDLFEATNGNIEALAKINPNIRSARAAFILAGIGVEEFATQIDAFNDLAGTTDLALADVANSSQYLWKQIKLRVNAAFYELGEPILRGLVIPSLQQLLAVLPPVTSRFTDIDEQVRVLNNSFTELEQNGYRLRQLFIALMKLSTFQKTSGEEFAKAIVGAPAPIGIPGADENLSQEPVHKRIVRLIELQGELKKAIEETQNTREKVVLQEVLRLRNQQFRGAVEDMRKWAVEADRAARAMVNPLAGMDDAGTKISDLLQDIPTLFQDAVTDAGLLEQIMNRIGDVALEEQQQLLGKLAEAFEAIAQVRLEGPIMFLDKVDEISEEPSDSLRAIAHQIDQIVNNGGDMDAVWSVLEDAGVTLVDLAEAFPQIAGGVLELEAGGTRAGRAMEDLAQDIGQAARAASELLAAFGLFGDDIPRVVNQLSLVGEGVTGAVDAMKAASAAGQAVSLGALAGPIGVGLGGLAGIAGSLMGSGPSPETLRRMEIEEENTRAVRKLSESLDALRELMLNLPGQVGQAISQLDAAFQEGFAGATDGGKFFGAIFEALTMPKTIRELQDELDRMGFTFTDLKEAAQQAGINIEDLEEVWEGALEGQTEFGGELIGAKNQWDDLVEAIGLGVTDLFETVTGRLESANRAIELWDIEDPLEQISKFVDVLEKSNVQLTGEEFARLRAGDEDLIRELVAELESGTGRFAEGFAALGEFSPNDFLEVLSTIEGLGDSIDDLADEGASDSFQTFNKITAEQGAAIIGALSTSNFYSRGIFGNTSDIKTQIEKLLREAGVVIEVPPPVVEVPDREPPPVDVSPVIEVETPSVDVQPPAVEVKAPDVTVQPPAVEAPSFTIQPPVVETPDITVQPPTAEVPDVIVQPPAAEVPDVIVQPPVVKVQVPDVVVQPAVISVEAPDITVQPPAVETPSFTIQPPVVESPSITIQPPVVDIPDVNVAPVVEPHAGVGSLEDAIKALEFPSDAVDGRESSMLELADAMRFMAGSDLFGSPTFTSITEAVDRLMREGVTAFVDPVEIANPVTTPDISPAELLEGAGLGVDMVRALDRLALSIDRMPRQLSVDDGLENNVAALIDAVRGNTGTSALGVGVGVDAYLKGRISKVYKGAGLPDVRY